MSKERLNSIRVAIALGFILIVYLGWHWNWVEFLRAQLANFHQIESHCKGRVGILVGHWRSGSGATCPDGIREVDINLTIARLTKKLLQRKGYQVDLLREFDSRLPGYEADVLIALHADSCVLHVQGFKLAVSPEPSIAHNNKKLSQCLWTEYAAKTGLIPQEAGITRNMLEYHVFYEIDSKTPAAILEMGFISTDREILLEHPRRAANGIVNALECFFEQ
jgi:N-acetylmuramoyl-L-alanine amidase